MYHLDILQQNDINTKKVILIGFCVLKVVNPPDIFVKLIYIKNSSRRRSSHFGRGPNVRKDFQSIGNELKSNFSLFTHPFSQFGRGPNIKKDFQSIGNEIYNNYSAVRKL